MGNLASNVAFFIVILHQLVSRPLLAILTFHRTPAFVVDLHQLHCPDDFRIGVNRDFSPGSSHKKSPAKSVGLRD